MKIIDETETQTSKQTKTKKKKSNGSYSERVRAKWFFVRLNFCGFLRLICKASLSFKSNLELALSVILKER